MKKIFVIMAEVAISLVTNAKAQTYLGNLSAIPYLPKAPPYPANTFNNSYGNSSNSPQLFNSQGQFRGNPYGAGGRYNPDSLNNPYSSGLTIIER